MVDFSVIYWRCAFYTDVCEGFCFKQQWVFWCSVWIAGGCWGVQPQLFSQPP